MFSISTGEPPTPPVPQTAMLTEPAKPDRIPSDSNQPEPDSGYEASPCSIADTTADDLHFFGLTSDSTDQSNPTASSDPTVDSDSPNSTSDPTDEVFDDFVLLDPEDCSCSSPCSCSRAESSATMLDSNCDSSDSDSNLASRPASLPIRIPPRTVLNSPRSVTNLTRNVHQSWNSNTNIPSTRALPTVFPFRIGHPRSCPAVVANWFVGSPMARVTSQMERLCRRQSQRRRRLQIDSDASSDVESSDDNFLSDDVEDEVFPMSVGGESSEQAVVPRLAPLPDIVLHSSPSSSSVVRRIRSASINLPPEPEVLQNIGSTLRRLSDQFEIRRVVGRRRRQTITSFDLR